MLSVDALERVFDQLALAIDDVGPNNEGLFLTKLAFVLANRLGNEGSVQESIALAREQLSTPTRLRVELTARPELDAWTEEESRGRTASDKG